MRLKLLLLYGIQDRNAKESYIYEYCHGKEQFSCLFSGRWFDFLVAAAAATTEGEAFFEAP